MTLQIMTGLSGWHMYFDEGTNSFRCGISVLLTSPHGDHISRLVYLAIFENYPTTKNMVKYETCILGLETTLELGIKQIKVFSDSNLVLRKIQGN
ncbi:hypothetical protein AAG906_001092 [Vitis piasezkii]